MYIFILSNVSISTRSYENVELSEWKDDHEANVSWVFKNGGGRQKRSSQEFEDPRCQEEFHRLCGSMGKDGDLAILECAQNFKVEP